MAKRTEDVYGEPVIFSEGNITAQIFHPILTPEEYERRMDRIKKAAVRIVLYGKKES